MMQEGNREDLKKRLIMELAEMQQHVATLHPLGITISEHEKLLYSSSFLLKTIYESTPDCIFIRDKQFRCLHVNPAAEKLLGISHANIIGSTDTDLFGKENAEQLGTYYNRALNGERVHNDVSLIIRGEERMFSTIEFPVYSANHEIIGLCSIMHDITARKAIEQQLYDEEKRLRYLYEQCPSGYQSLDNDGRFIDVNQAWLDLFGYSREEVSGKAFTDFLASEHMAEFEQTFISLKEAGKIRSIEFKMRKKDGEYIPVALDGNSSTDDTGRFKQTHFILRDVSELRQRDNYLQEHKAMLESIFRAAPAGIGIVKKRIFVWTNEMIHSMTGYTEQELKNKSSRMLYPSDEEYEHVGEVKYKQLKSKNIGVIETQWITKDGRVIDVLLSSTFLDPFDLSQGVTFTALDITAQKKREIENLAQKSAIEQKNIALQEILAQIEMEKKQFQEQVSANVEKLVLPGLRKLYKRQSVTDKQYIKIIEDNIKKLTSSFGIKVSASHLNLTPREIEVCNLIKNGFSSKDIAESLNISFLSVETHRRNIRKKLDISNKPINLTAYLQRL